MRPSFGSIHGRAACPLSWGCPAASSSCPVGADRGTRRDQTESERYRMENKGKLKAMFLIPSIIGVLLFMIPV
ncbi:MAG: hypothetical protein IJR14_06350, partial [Synergistaceae bacterium]|nr:hypothetical protein [Synergistaceae bacterium]